jgi:hypothetical protein
LDRELPGNGYLLGYAISHNSQDFSFECFNRWNAPIETESGERRELDFNHVELAGRLGCEIEFEAFSQGPGFIGRQVLIKSAGVMGIEIILNQSDFDSDGKLGC